MATARHRSDAPPRSTPRARPGRHALPLPLPLPPQPLDRPRSGALPRHAVRGARRPAARHPAWQPVPPGPRPATGPAAGPASRPAGTARPDGPRRPRHRQEHRQEPSEARRRSPLAARHSRRPGLGLLRVGLLGAGLLLALAGAGGVATLLVGVFTASTASGSTLAFASLDSWLPSGVTTSRVTSTTCQVSWTPHGSAPVGATYDVTDGTSTLASDVAGTTTVVTAGAGAVTPVVKLRVGTWVSSSGTAAASACLGWPDAPVVSVTPSQTQVSATWTAPAGNGASVASYAATISPAGTGTSSCSVLVPASRSCVFTGLTDGVTYTVSVTATSSQGTGPAGTATAIPYPSSVMTGSATKLWLDGADPSTLFASSSCSGAAASSTVGCWADKSGQADNATQSTAGSRPSLSSLNGHPAAAFDGSSSVMALDVTKLPTGSADSTTWLVATMEDPSPLTTSHRAAIGWGDNGTGTTRAVTKPWHSTLAYQDLFSGVPWPAGASWSATGTVFSGRLSGGATSTVDVDGARSYTETVALSTGTAAGAWLGNHIWGNWASWQGRIAEVVVLNQAASDAENRTVQEYLARKWGLTITPQAPTAVTVSPTAAGTSADVAWTAPSWNGGSVVTGYTVTAVPATGGGNVTCTAVHPSTSCTLSGLAGGGAQYTVTVTATNATGTGPGSTAVTMFAGLPVTTNLKLWLDGADAASMYGSSACSGSAATGPVGCWKDKSGSLDHAVQGVAGWQPALSTVNGHPVPAFAGASGSSSLAFAVPSTLPSGGTGSVTFAVADPDASMTNPSLVWWSGSPATGTGRVWSVDTSASPVLCFSTAFAGPTACSTPTVSWGSRFTLSSAVDGTGADASMNGVAATSASGAISTQNTMGGLGNWQGPVPEVLVYSGSLTSTERRSVEEYLAAKWAVTIAPSVPQAASAVAGVGTATVSWMAPASNGGSPITSYTVTPVGGAGSCTWTAGTSAACSGLTKGTSYTFAVAATNAVGTGSSVTTAAVTPTGVPDAPTGVAATADDTVSSVSWTAPANTGGSAITSYTATAVPSDGTLATKTCSSASSPCSLSGLTNGVTYTVSVTATNAIGTSTASGSTTAIPYPKTVFTGGTLKLWLDGADPATLYASSGCSGAAASSTVGCWKDKSGQANNATQSTGANQPTLATVSGRSVPSFDGSSQNMLLTPGLLPNGTSVSTSFLVGRMTNAAPAASAYQSALVWGTAVAGGTRAMQKATGSANAVVDTHSGSLSSGGAWTTNTSGILSDAWTATTYTGYFNTVAGNTVTASFTTGTTDARIGATIGPGEFWQGQLPEALVFGSTLSSTDRRQVDEYLARKWGVAITPAAPQGASASAGNATATVSWSAPAWNGGASVTSYTVTPVGGAGSCTWSSGTTASCTGLSNGTSYTFTVAAVNSAGTGPTATTAAVTPTGPPGAPTAVTATADDTVSSVSWTAPASNGGSAITSYTATAVPSDGTLPTRTCSAATSPCTLSGLTDGVTYTVSVTATNALGTSSASTSTTVIPYPKTIMSGGSFALWLDGADAATLYASSGCSGAAASSAVGCWTDKSGTGNNATQATGTNQPGTTTVAGRSVPLYDGTNDRLALTPALLPTGSTSGTEFGVATTTEANPASSDYRAILGYGTGSTAQARLLGKYTFSTSAYADTWSSGSVTGGTWANGTTSVLASEYAATLVRLAWAGGPYGTGTSSTFNTGTTGAMVGSNLNGANPWKGSISEVLVFSTTLSTADQRTVAEYLARKWSSTITPAAPQSASATAGNATATVSWSAPAWNGGASVTSYTVTPVGGAGSCTWSSGTTASCTGLSNGTSYTFTVAAVNSVGTGPTATTAAVTPYTVPAAPTAVAATADDTVSSVSWSAPASTGGSAITSYTATAVPSDGTLATRTCSSASSPCSLSGLTNGVTYTVSVTATNAAGAGSPSSSTTVIPYPKTVMSGATLKLWLDGADSTMLYASSTCSGAAATTTVGCWKDKSGSANNATQGTGANQPTLTTVNGRSVPGFDGSNDLLSLSASLLPNGTSSSTEIVAVATTLPNPAAVGYRIVMGHGASASGQTRVIGKDQSVATAYADTFAIGYSANGSWVSGTLQMMAAEFASAAVRTAWMGGAYGSATSAAFNTATTGASIGADQSGLNPWMGPIPEVVIFSTTLSSTDKRSVEEYLARKWGMTITPGTPQSASATAGTGTATVSWSAPAWNGGASVSAYTVTPVGGPGSCTWSSGTTASCTGLTHGVSYTFTVAATNSVGTGPTTTTAAVTP